MSTVRRTVKASLMGSSFELGIVCKDDRQAQNLLELAIGEIKRIESQLTEFRTDSLTSLLNASAGGPGIKVSEEFMQLMQRCGHIHRLSQGYFDPTASVLKSLYTFEGKIAALPTAAKLETSLKLVGFQKIRIDVDRSEIALPEKGMRISFAAIGKGYAADRVQMMWKKENLIGGYVNASGDLSAFGTDENGNPWTIGIADPELEGSSLLHLPLSGKSIATSGQTYQFFDCDGKRYSHNIDPLTGKAVSGIKSVSVISPSAELSDALATAIHAMGIKKGMAFANQLPATHTLIIDNNKHIHLSKNLDYAATP